MFNNFLSFMTPADSDDNPARMKGNEPLLGLVVAFVIVVVAVLDLTVTTGAGAPKHSTTWAPIAGIILAAALALSLRFRNRLASPFLAIIGAFFVEFSKTPKSLSVPHLVTLVVAVGFALIVSMRQRTEQKAMGPARSSSDRRAAADARRRRRKGEPEPASTSKRPAQNARYTPPKSKTPPKR